MNQTIDFWIILFVKLLLLVGFISGIKFWINRNKEKKNIPMIVYWILGLFFVLILSSHIFEATLFSIFLNPENISSIKESLSSYGILLGLLFYIFIGVKYLKK